MTHVLDVDQDLDALVGHLDHAGDEAHSVSEPAQDERPPLVRPLAGLTTPVWYL